MLTEACIEVTLGVSFWGSPYKGRKYVGVCWGLYCGPAISENYHMAVGPTFGRNDSSCKSLAQNPELH